MKFLILLLLLFMAASCEISDPDATIRMEIDSILYDIRTGFHQNDIERIMHHVHWEYRHDGMNYYQYRELWQDRMGVWSTFDFENLSINVNGDMLTASFTLRLSNAAGSAVYNEPEDNGDTSYFLYDGNTWKIIGNQHPY